MTRGLLPAATRVIGDADAATGAAMATLTNASNASHIRAETGAAVAFGVEL